jgi:hypothetical protein
MASKEENTFEKTWNELNNYIKNIGFDIEDFSYEIKFNGVFWTLELEGMSIDGEEQYFNYDDFDLESLFNQVKDDM